MPFGAATARARADQGDRIRELVETCNIKQAGDA
jgi:hypothetical protein